MNYNKKFIVIIMAIAYTHTTMYGAFRNVRTKLYAPFRHPVYKELIEPLYVGYKAPYAGQKTKEQLNYLMMDAHDKFKKITYKKWKETLTPDELSEHEQDILAYEHAYYHYKGNPHDPEIHEELLDQTQHIYEIMQHTHNSRQLKEHIFDVRHR